MEDPECAEDGGQQPEERNDRRQQQAPQVWNELLPAVTMGKAFGML